VEKRHFQHQFADNIVGNLMDLYHQRKQFDRAEPWRRKWLAAVKERAAGDAGAYADQLAALGASPYKPRNPAGAEPLPKQALSPRRAKLGPGHPETLFTMHALAVAYDEDGKADRAVPLFEEVLTHKKADPGSDDAKTLVTMYRLALAYRRGGKLDLALPLWEE